MELLFFGTLLRQLFEGNRFIIPLSGSWDIGFRCGAAVLGGFGADQAVGTVADEVLATCFAECFTHQRGVLRAVELQKRALQLLFVIVGGNVDRLHVQRVDSGVEHDR